LPRREPRAFFDPHFPSASDLAALMPTLMSLMDEFLPDYQFSERHQVTMRCAQGSLGVFL
jgi:hypothetical protein